MKIIATWFAINMIIWSLGFMLVTFWLSEPMLGAVTTLAVGIVALTILEHKP